MQGETNQGATTANFFDDKPIGKQHKFDIPEYADNEVPTVIGEQNAPGPRPLGERLKKNILKIKRQALEELLTLVKEDPKEYQPYQSLTSDFLSFKDPIVQDKGLKVLNLYLASGNNLTVEPKTIIKVIIEKCLSLEKDEIKLLSQQVLFWYMDHKDEEILLTQLNDYLLSKNRKVVGISITFIATLLNNYGIKRMKNLQRFAKNLQFLSASPKPVAKNEAINLFKELYRWLGESCLKDFKIHPQIKDEIVKFAKDYKKQPLEIKRGLPSMKQKGQNKSVYYMQEEQTENNEPVDVLNSYTSEWVNNLLKLEKWKEKKVALDEFIKKIKVPCILPPKEVSHFIFLIKKLLADKNINLCYCGFYITQNMSKGLKKNFSHIAKNILDQVFIKLKDLKVPTVQLTQATLKNLLQALSLDDFIQNIKDGLNDKAPQMKEETMKFMSNFIEKKQLKIMNTLRTFIDKIIQLTEDGAVKVRSQALDTLCAFKVIHGMKFFGEKVKKLDPKKLQTLQLAKGPAKNEEMMEIEEVQLKPQSVIQYPSESSILTVKPKQSKSMEIEYEAPKGVLLPKNIIKNEESASVSSVGQIKVARSLNLDCLDDISNPNQSMRNTAYVQISTKFLSKDLKQFMKIIKNNAMKESSPTILKSILQIAKKYVNGGTVDLDLAEFLAKHDWKKMKQLIMEFIQNNKINSEADELIKTITSSFNNTKMTVQNDVNQYTLKKFSIQLQNTMISKMSSPIDSIKKEACQNAITFWENIPKIMTQAQFVPSNGWNQEHFSKLFNVVKCRLSDSNQQITELYCRLLRQMINKGMTMKKSVLKAISQMLYANIGKGLPEVKALFKQMVVNSPSYMFLAMQGQIFLEAKQSALVEFIVENSDLFIKYADFKAFIAPFLHLLCSSSLQMTLKQGLSSVFTQIVQISGQAFLEKQVSKLKITNFQAYSEYLKQFHINLNKSNYPNTGKNFRVKEDRLKYWQEQQWHLQITSNQVIKLINMMSNLGEPFNSLCTVFFLNEKEIRELDGLEFNFLAEYSDILFKYIFWRVQTDPLEVVQYLLRFTGRLVLAIGCHITQTDVIVLMRTFISTIERFKNTVKQQIVQILKRSFKIKPELQKDTFQFWLNYLSSSSQACTNEILNIFMACYENNLAESFVQLARISTVHKYELFLNFLQHKFQIQHLTASGFRFDSSSIHNQGNDRLSELGGPQNMLSIQPSQVYAIYEIFQKNSEHCLAKLAELAKLEGIARVQQYVKMLYSIIRPFFHGEIQIINMFCFLRELQKVLTQPYQTKRGQLRQLARMLLYLLVDLDEKPPNGTKCEQIMKIVNKCILTLIQTSQPRHVLEILFLLARRHLELGISTKIVHLVIKCMIRAVKAPDFNQNLIDNLNFVFDQTNALFQTHNLQTDSPFMKTLKLLYSDILKNYPLSLQLMNQKIDQGQLHVNFKFLHQEITRPEEHAAKEDQETKRQLTPSNVGSFSSTVLKKVCNIKSDSNQEDM